MPTLELTPGELRSLAMALRLAARQAETDASHQGNQRIRETFAADARDCTALVERIEGVRAKSALPTS